MDALQFLVLLAFLLLGCVLLCVCERIYNGLRGRDAD